MPNPKPLTEQQLDQYFRDGYIVVPGLVSLASVEAARAATAPVSGLEWAPSIFDHENPDASPQEHRMLVEPNIIAAVEQIFEAPARVYYGFMAIVPARGGKGLPWHQDNQYTHILPAALNTYVALCDITPDKALLWVAPQSHRLGRQPSKDAGGDRAGHREAVTEPENGISLPTLKAGDVCIFDRNTYHRSLKNETDEDRYAYAAQYMAEYSRLAATGQKDEKRMRAQELQQRWAGLLE